MEKTFAEFDKFGLKEFADYLTHYLLDESKYYEDSYVLSLNGGFGCGKTTFLEMWKTELETHNPKDFNVIFINAWKSDYLGDPLLTIVSHLLKELPPEITKGKGESIKETVGKLAKFGLSIGNDLVIRATGINFIKAGEYAEPKESKEKPSLGHDLFKTYQQKEELFDTLKEELGKLANSMDQPILIILDELDRCKPNYAIEFLETIKHFFDIKGLVFVLAIDKAQLSSSAKAMFGQDLDFDEYYRKFAQRSVDLPVNSWEMTEKFTREIVMDYLSPEAYKNKTLFPYAKFDRDNIDAIANLCVALSFNARQIHEFLRITAHVLSFSKEIHNNMFRGWTIGVYFMSAISIKDRTTYNKIGRREILPSEFTVFFKTMSLSTEGHSYNDWAALLYMGIFSGQNEQIMHEFQELGIWKRSNNDINAFKGEFEGYAIAYDDRGKMRRDIFSTIYEKIERLKTFEKN